MECRHIHITLCNLVKLIPVFDNVQVINPRHACTARVTVVVLCVCVCVCVCVSVNQQPTSGASVCPENAVTYSAGNKGQKICGTFSETAPLQRSSTSRIVWLSFVSHFSLCGKKRMHYHRVCMWRTDAALLIRSHTGGMAP